MAHTWSLSVFCKKPLGSSRLLCPQPLRSMSSAEMDREAPHPTHPQRELGEGCRRGCPHPTPTPAEGRGPQLTPWESPWVCNSHRCRVQGCDQHGWVCALCSAGHIPHVHAENPARVASTRAKPTGLEPSWTAHWPLHAVCLRAVSCDLFI